MISRFTSNLRGLGMIIVVFCLVIGQVSTFMLPLKSRNPFGTVEYADSEEFSNGAEFIKNLENYSKLLEMQQDPTHTPFKRNFSFMPARGKKTQQDVFSFYGSRGKRAFSRAFPNAFRKEHFGHNKETF
uniref:FMRFamide-related neuropeptides-like n=1 Tax=Rhabditophanes sp. KR3021 TaxID=114890 RepID=A0AC35UFC3_9BILA